MDELKSRVADQGLVLAFSKGNRPFWIVDVSSVEWIAQHPFHSSVPEYGALSGRYELRLSFNKPLCRCSGLEATAGEAFECLADNAREAIGFYGFAFSG
ncbi:hypothetical protein K1T73_06120 [Roseovarius sp. SCSIO 43702]|uniref:hypothetical protein n=1 Tax=Roseovarius sp. SCSIO 43702 TaxID=2823043 RepID=UPI001C73C0BF|nr:hypothetical protein [Roseovarius sp. SCSIO 43702]QYX57958.1 hypothetical protein K1T73_06120 [Roseovarius sp. SCSIO 43702]